MAIHLQQLQNVEMYRRLARGERCRLREAKEAIITNAWEFESVYKRLPCRVHSALAMT